jgi:hypothetical protein
VRKGSEGKACNILFVEIDFAGIAFSRPVITLKSVLLPAPFGPIMARNSPSFTPRVTRDGIDPTEMLV